MATVVNNPPAENSRNNNGLMIGIFLVILVLVLLVIFGLPSLRGGTSAGGSQINTPSTPKVNVQGGVNNGGY